MSLQSFFSTLGRSLNIFDSDRPSIYSSNPEKKTVFSELGNVIQGAWNDYTGNTANQANIDYQKEYNEQVFKRADTQYQRTVADLRAAGFSSQLAAGSPSTVAGASSAPQRTVGNESAAIERLVGMITAMKQTDANATLAAAQADKARADAASVNVDTKLKNLELGSYGERTTVSIALQRSQARLNTANTRLLQIEGHSKSYLINSQIVSNLASAAHSNALVDLVAKQIEVANAEIKYTGALTGRLGIENEYTKALTGKIGVENEYTKALTSKVSADINEINKRVSLISYQIASEISKKENLDAQTKLVVREEVNAALDAAIEQAAYDYNVDRGDHPYATQVSSSQDAQASKKAFRDSLTSYLLSGVNTVSSILSGIAVGFGFQIARGAGGKVTQKMFDEEKGTFGFHL